MYVRDTHIIEVDTIVGVNSHAARPDTLKCFTQSTCINPDLTGSAASALAVESSSLNWIQ